MKVTIHQPNFFPRLKVLQKISSADIWVVLDNVQFAYREWQNRCKIISFHGNHEPFWCTLPVTRNQGRSTLIKDIEILNQISVLDKIYKSFHVNLGKTTDWEKIEAVIRKSLETSSVNGSLTKIGVDSTLALLSFLGKSPQVLYSSQLNVYETDKTLRLAEICKLVNATEYLADSGAASYLNDSNSVWGDISILWQEYMEPNYDKIEIPSFRNVSSLNLACRDLQYFISYCNNPVFSKIRPR
jgi:hypothetical protein